MGVLDKDYIFYCRLCKGAMKTVLKGINSSAQIGKEITEKELEKNPELVKIIREQLQDGFRELFKSDAVQDCIDYRNLNERRKIHDS